MENNNKKVNIYNKEEIYYDIKKELIIKKILFSLCNNLHKKL